MEMASMVTIGEVVKLKEKPKSARYYDKETRAKLIRRVGELAAMGMGEDDFYSSLLADGFKAPNGEKLKRTTVIHMLYRAKRALGTSRTYRNRRKPQESAHSAPRERRTSGLPELVVRILSDDSIAALDRINAVLVLAKAAPQAG
jgi:hypothetical protein